MPALRVPALRVPALRAAALRAGGGRVDASLRAPLVADTLQRDVLAALTREAAKLLTAPLEPLRADVMLPELGFDSLALAVFVEVLNETYGLALTPTVFFEHPTLERVARHLAETHRDAMAAHFAQVGAGETPARQPAGRQRSSVSRMRVRRATITDAAEPIAIVGMSGRFPMAKDVDELWANLVAGRDCISEIPPERWDWRAIYGEAGQENRTHVKWGGFIDGVDEFDPQFFNISPREAELMDPQHRLLLLHVWKAIEDAGYAPSSLAGSNTGVFVGAGLSDYARLLGEAQVAIDGFTAIGTVPSVGPNRVSYLLDLHGPSEPIETACSSSLVAVHRAVAAMRGGQCDMAIVGGVNTILTPDLHISCTKAGMLSGEGRCKTFSDRADGYVRSEGVGILVLKKLADAEAAGDSIYGVILGSAENHGGRATSITAPNPRAQAELLRRAYRQAKVDPATVSYIEAHGTGTELGDPIEVDALGTAFADLYAERGTTPVAGHCGLGSVKSNIGHLELAAGVAGVIKVLLQLKHRTLVPTLHAETLNPYLKIDGSPFTIVRETREWTPFRAADGTVLPRRAGVSSFGFGGVNAHVVIEEYRPRAERASAPARPAMIVLSARDEERLRERVEELLAAVRRGSFAEEELSAIAYTLQVGRDAMDARFGCIVHSLAELEEKLQAFLDGRAEYRGDARSNRDVLSLVTTGGAFDAVVERWFDDGQADKLLELWVKGLKIDWERLYRRFDQDAKPRRVSLPSYPFARESYWVPQSAGTRAALAGPARLHPLVHENTSDLDGQRYRTVLTGRESFLADHRIDGRRWLPAVAYLEMAREAVARATGDTDRSIELRDVIWVRPVAVASDPVEVHVGLSAEDGGTVAFEIYGDSADGEVVYARGVAVPAARLLDDLTTRRLDVASIEQRYAAGSLPAETCYAAFDAMGIAFGAAHRGLQGVHVGTDGVVARVALPATAAATRDEYVLHPSVMDAALQATLGFSLAGNAALTVADRALPFALEALEIHGSSPATGWVVVRRTRDDRAAGIARYDVELCDDEGSVSVRLRGLSTRRVVAVDVAAETAAPAPAIDADGLQREVEAALTRIASGLLKLPAGHFQRDAQFQALGFDSIVLIAFADRLKGEFGFDVTPTLFFENPSIARLAGVLVERHRDVLAAHLATPAAAAVVVAAKAPDSSAERRVRTTRGRAAAQPAKPEPIAIVGMSGRFPMAKDVEELWANLVAGRDCIDEIPAQRWDWRAFYGDPALENKTNVKWGGFIEGVDEFDPQFFNIPQREADLMDPQQRLLLMHVWKAIETAGYAPSSLGGTNTGVFVATGMSDYARVLAQAGIGNDGFTAMGTAAASVGPNRVSYLLDLRGPSEPIETTCSSSLVAVHRAVGAMRTGQCDMAIVGGVNTILTPDLHIGCTKAGMLSPDGRCKTFAKGANGFVRSEGIGILMLKKLSDAEAAGDPIHGLILGSAENHGGRANSFTSPNPRAQAELLHRAYLQAGIDPASVTYIEAHGTGTELGDPIEIEGLKTAFGNLYAERGSAPVTGHCGLGSVKSNVGHLELAAGVTGMIKVLLQLKHRTLVRSLHSETVNPYIQLDGSPFYLVREAREWTALPAADGTAIPRRAGVSSFGFGGVNAHVVLEEYQPRAERQKPAPRPAMVVLSARDEERLREQVEGLLGAVRRRALSDSDVLDVAYTLQVGREAMDARFGCIAGSIGELEQKLQAFLDEKRSSRDRGAAEAVRLLTADEEFRGVIDRWIEQGRAEKLLELWLSGAKLDWERLYQDARPRRMALPTYPFARKRCWVADRVAGAASLPSPRSFAAMPFVPADLPAAQDDSDPFSTVVTGEEFFLSDHVVHGRKVLPAVVYLEMARAAVERASASMVRREDGSRGVTLRSVVWVRPFFAGSEPARMQMRLVEESGGELKFQLYGDVDGKNVVYGQGRGTPGAPDAIDLVDLAAIRARCTQQHYSAGDCYGAFDAMGYHYGPAHQGIVDVHVGSDELLAQLRLPAPVAGTLNDFVLHPALGDSAAQSVIAFLLSDRRSADEPLQPALPFELESAEIFRPCTPAMWAWIRRDGGTYDIDLCDEAGRVSTRIRGWTTRVLAQSAAPAARPVPAGDGAEPLMLIPTWEAGAVERQELPAGPAAVIGGTGAQRAAIQRLYPDAHLLPVEANDSVDAIRARLVECGAIAHLVWIVPHAVVAGVADDALLAAQREGVFAGFRIVKALLAEGYGDRPLTWSVLTTQTQAVRATDSADPAHASVHGLIGSAAKEYAGWNVRLLDLPATGEWPWNDVFSVRAEADGNALVHRDGLWYRQQLVPYRPAGEPPVTERRGDVVVIVGGAGGIGGAWSEELIRRSQVQFVWIGRRPKDEALQARLNRLAELGPAPLYIAADATDRVQLEAARETILRAFGRIDGIVHAALVLQDRALANMTEEEFAAGLAPKVDVSVRLAQVFAQDPPRYVLFFSSLNAFAKLPGQSNYVAGCTFEDVFARRLAAEWPSRVRVINWGYWGSVGAVASERYRVLMARKGFGSIEAPDAVGVLDRLLSGPVAQLAFAKTTAPAAIDGLTIRAGEAMTHFAEVIPSCAGALDVPAAAAEVAHLRTAASASEEIDASLVDLMWAQLQSMRLFGAVSATREELQERAGIADRYTRWLDYTIGVLQARGYVVADGDGWSASDAAPADSSAAWQSWDSGKAQWVNDSDWGAHVQFAELALRVLPEILTGRRATTDILFADLFGDAPVSLIGKVLRGGPPTRFCNRVLADLVRDYVGERKRRDPGCRLRILEIGAGTGSTTEVVLEALRPHEQNIQEYAFTDVSMAFLTIAEKWLASRPAHLQFRTFDVERPAAGQDFAAGAYDLVIASNVLHATQDIVRTLRNAKSAMKANGLLLLSELTGSSVFNHLTFGLLDGWWLFADPQLRVAGSPALRPRTWQAVLEQEGFRAVRFPADAAHELGHQVVVAESDGVVRHAAGQEPPREILVHESPRVEVKRAEPVPSNIQSDAPASLADVMAGPREGAIEYLLADLRQRVARILGADLATLDAEAPFADSLLGEFGMDSLSSNDLRNTLRQELGVDIPVQRIIGDPVRIVVDAIYDQLLLRHVTAGVTADDEGEHRETFVF
jgi:polyketide synthase PksN